MKCYGVTGHRPPRLGLSYDDASRRRLRTFAARHLSLLKPARVISGMAQGWDQAVAEACVELGIPFVAALPFEAMEAKWPTQAQKTFLSLLDKAESVTVVCPGGYAAWKLIRRDEWVVDTAEAMLALYDGLPKGGTAHTVKYAGERGMVVVNVWKEWLQLRCMEW